MQLSGISKKTNSDPKQWGMDGGGGKLFWTKSLLLKVNFINKNCGRITSYAHLDDFLSLSFF